jgi:hypothetical protein
VQTARPLPAADWDMWLRCFVPLRTYNDPGPSSITRWAKQTDGRPRKAFQSWKGRCIFDRRLPPADAPRTSPGGAVLMPVILHVPADAPETTRPGQGGAQWVLAVRARAWPVSFVAEFELPVFRTHEPQDAPADEG